MRLNLTFGEYALMYTSLKSELRYLAELGDDEKWVVERIAEINELISKLDSM